MCSPLICLYAQIVNSKELECLLHCIWHNTAKVYAATIQECFRVILFFLPAQKRFKSADAVPHAVEGEAGIRPAGRWKWARGRNIEGAHCSINCTFVLVDCQILKTPIWNDQWCSMLSIIHICVLPLVGIYLVTNLHCISGLICRWSVGWMVSLLGLLAKIKV